MAITRDVFVVDLLERALTDCAEDGRQAVARHG
jgi:hypothetical protein